MTETIQGLFDQYRKHVDSDAAAATLVLAHVQSNQQPVQDRETLNPADVAKRLAVSPATVISWIKSGQLKAANIATGPRPRFVIQEAAVEAFLGSRQSQPPVSRRRGPQKTSLKRY